MYIVIGKSKEDASDRQVMYAGKIFSTYVEALVKSNMQLQHWDLSVVRLTDTDYSDLPKSMDIYTPPGAKVVFLDENGYDIQRDNARKHLVKGQVCVVEEVSVDRFDGEVKINGRLYNTVMFANFEESNNTIDCIRVV